MKFEIYQWLVPLLSVFYIIRILLQQRSGKRSLRSVVIWSTFWTLIALLAIVPNQISFQIAELLGFKSNVNAIIFVALGWLILMVFYLSATLEKLERKLTELVRELSLQEQAEKDKKGSD